MYWYMCGAFDLVQHQCCHYLLVAFLHLESAKIKNLLSCTFTCILLLSFKKQELINFSR